MKSKIFSLEYWRANIGLPLLAVNLVLAVILFLQANPFSLWKTGYEGAANLLKEQKLAENVTAVRLFHPQYAENVHSLVLRPDTQRNTGWELLLENEGGTNFTFAADADGVKGLLQALENARRYYAVDRNEERDREFEIEVAKTADGGSGDADGNGKSSQAVSLNGLTIVLEYKSGDSEVIYVGKLTSDQETYVRLANEERFYLVQEDMFGKSGGRDIHYFRDRSLLASDVLIKSLQMESESGQGIVKWENRSGIWQQIYPPLAAGDNRILDQQKVTAILQQVRQLRIQSFLSELPDAASEAANRIPRTRFLVRYTDADNLSDQRQLEFLVIARQEQEIIVEFVGEQGQKHLYTISGDVFAQLQNYQSFLTSASAPAGASGAGSPPAPAAGSESPPAGTPQP